MCDECVIKENYKAVKGMRSIRHSYQYIKQEVENKGGGFIIKTI